eukprot:TRINITY_DN9878_c1_g2_i1.p4 TRINITY_DN9878_c1_g2~~TRINITY_DN9878_c1_g2_i1.p4  ORF type:complete len:145 (+),score=4.92 TRINITY_DN9878_c1_g2_i1:550-984(+)
MSNQVCYAQQRFKKVDRNFRSCTTPVSNKIKVFSFRIFFLVRNQSYLFQRLFCTLNQQKFFGKQQIFGKQSQNRLFSQRFMYNLKIFLQVLKAFVDSFTKTIRNFSGTTSRYNCANFTQVHYLERSTSKIPTKYMYPIKHTEIT